MVRMRKRMGIGMRKRMRENEQDDDAEDNSDKGTKRAQAALNYAEVPWYHIAIVPVT